MFTAILSFHVVCCTLLIIIVLMQSGKGEGLAGAFGAGGGQTIFGSRTGDILTRTTTILAIVFMVTSLVLARLSTHRGESIVERLATTEESVPGPSEPVPSK